MKNASIFPTLFLLCFTLFISQTAQAQWSQTATTIYPATLTKKIGIGLNNPTYALEIKGIIGLRANDNSTLGYLGDDGLGNLRISANTTVSPGGSKNLLLNPPGLSGTPGRVGIGTTTPTEARLVVKGDAIGHTIAMFGQGQAGISLVRDWATVGFNAYYASGTWKAMSTGYGGLLGCDPLSGRMEIIQNGQATNANDPVSTVVALTIAPGGNVLIGTGNDHGYKLAVNGNIRAKEIRVQSDWADYVFADAYPLRPLAEVEAFIKVNRHLPEIQPASEIQANGLDMAATTTKMMAKIEELTLYLIDMKKENEALKARVEKLEKP